jgi:hypothetical protein
MTWTRAMRRALGPLATLPPRQGGSSKLRCIYFWCLLHCIYLVPLRGGVGVPGRFVVSVGGFVDCCLWVFWCLVGVSSLCERQEWLGVNCCCLVAQETAPGRCYPCSSCACGPQLHHELHAAVWCDALREKPNYVDSAVCMEPTMRCALCTPAIFHPSQPAACHATRAGLDHHHHPPPPPGCSFTPAQLHVWASCAVLVGLHRRLACTFAVSVLLGWALGMPVHGPPAVSGLN